MARLGGQRLGYRRELKAEGRACAELAALLGGLLGAVTL